MKISVIIPVYNVERYLARCLDSVLAAVEQLKPGVEVEGRTMDCSAEIICVNDGSTDGSAEMLRQYSSTFNLQPSTFAVLTQPNGGLGSARNAALDVATGDYVMFVDSDDYIPPHAISAFVFAAEKTGLQLVVSSSFLKDSGSGVKFARRNAAEMRVSIRKREWICGRKVQYCAWNKFYRCDLWKGRRFPATVFEDFPTTTGILCDIKSFAVIDEPLYVYCVNAGAQTLVHSPFGMKKTADSFTIIRQVLDYAKGRESWGFALRQAADGLSSTIGKVYKSKDGDAITELIAQCDLLKSDCYDVFRRMSIKAKLRLRLLKHFRANYAASRLNGVELPAIAEIERLVARDIGVASVSLWVNRNQGFSSRTFVGDASDGRRLFVKIGGEVLHSLNVHKICAGIPFVPQLYGHDNFNIAGFPVLVMSWIGGRSFVKFERLSEGQLTSFVRGYCEFSRRIQALRAETRQYRRYGHPEEDYRLIWEYSQKSLSRQSALKAILDIPVSDRTFMGREKQVIHNDFASHNYAFDDRGLSAIYDFDALGLGHPAEELLLALGIRYRESSLGFLGRRKLRRYFRIMVTLSGYSISEWRMAVNMYRLRWAAAFVRSRPDRDDYLAKIVRRDRRSCELLAVLDEMERST